MKKGIQPLRTEKERKQSQKEGECRSSHPLRLMMEITIKKRKKITFTRLFTKIEKVELLGRVFTTEHGKGQLDYLWTVRPLCVLWVGYHPWVLGIDFLQWNLRIVRLLQQKKGWTSTQRLQRKRHLELARTRNTCMQLLTRQTRRRNNHR